MAGGHRFASHGGATLSRGWLCQRVNEAPGHPGHPPPLSNAVVNYCLLGHLIKAYKAMCPGVVDFATGLVISILNFPEQHRSEVFGECKLQKNCNQCSSKFFWAS